MVTQERLSKSDIKRARRNFWVMWSLLITVPATFISFMFSYGTWWVYTLAIMACTVFGTYIFEFWLARRQEQATNTIVLCYCAHAQGLHHDDLGMCQHYTYKGRNEIGPRFTRCLCLNYTPRFWQMARRT